MLAAGALLPPAAAHGDAHERIAALTHAIASTPADAQLWLRRAELQRRHHRFESAAADIRRARELGAAESAWRLASARLELDRQRPSQAVRVLTPLLDAAPNESEPLALRARALEALGQHAAALRDHARRFAAHPTTDVDDVLAWAACAERAGDDEAAVAAVEAGRARLGPLVVLQRWRVEHHARRERFDAAIGVLEELIEASPRPEAFYVRRGEIELEAGRAEAARVSFGQAQLALQRLPAAHQDSLAMASLRARIGAGLRLAAFNR